MKSAYKCIFFQLGKRSNLKARNPLDAQMVERIVISHPMTSRTHHSSRFNMRQRRRRLSPHPPTRSRSLYAIIFTLLIACGHNFPTVHSHNGASSNDDNQPANKRRDYNSNFRHHDYNGLTMANEMFDFVIGGYLPEYRSYINLNATASHLTDLMLFSLAPGTILSSRSGDWCCLSSEHYDLIRKARSYKLEQQALPRQKETRIRLLITIGGGERSLGFRDIVMGSSNIRNQFFQRLVKLW